MDENTNQQYLLASLNAGRAQLEAIEQELTRVDNTIHEFEHALTTLEYLSSKKGEVTAMLPLGAKTFVEVTIPSNITLRRDIGQGVVIKKSAADFKKDIEQDIKMLKQIQKKLVEDKNNTLKALQDIENKLRNPQQA